MYCKIPFKKSSKSHPMIVHYAKIIGRTPSALNMKIGNIGRLDKDLSEQGITGLRHGAKMEEKVWEEFYDAPDKLAYESELLLAQFMERPIEEVSGIELPDLPEGTERNALVKQRVNQTFFRRTVLSSYHSTCCISGLVNEKLVEACHIMGWAEDAANRTNPCNGLCMNSLFHKAYDNLLLSITPDMKVVVSAELINDAKDLPFKEYLKGINGKEIFCPDKFFPKKEFLDAHYTRYLKR